MTVNRKSATARHAAGETASPVSYEAALDELERLVAAMEGQQLPLEQLLESYKRGAELLAFCRGRLQAIEQQVKVLDSESMKTEEDF